MSADYWGNCPKCHEKESLREDYELGIDGRGTFYVIFSAECECGFTFKFEHEEKNVAKND